MKKHILILKAFLVFALFISINTVSFAQPAGGLPPLPPAAGHGSGGNGRPSGGAPIGNGTYILITLAAAYALRKVYIWRKDTAKE